MDGVALPLVIVFPRTGVSLGALAVLVLQPRPLLVLQLHPQRPLPVLLVPMVVAAQRLEVPLARGLLLEVAAVSMDGVALPLAIVSPRTDVSLAAREVTLLLLLHPPYPLHPLHPLARVSQFCPHLHLASSLTQPGYQLPMAPAGRLTQERLVLDGRWASAVLCTGFVEILIIIVVMGANLVLARVGELPLLPARLLLRSQTGALSPLLATLEFLLCMRVFFPTVACSSWIKSRTTPN
jgi:hypothetical protein